MGSSSGPAVSLLEAHVGNVGGLVTSALLALPFFAVVFRIFERRWPLEPRTANAGPSPTDVGYWLLSPLVQVVSRALVSVLMIVCASMAGRRVGADLLHGFGPIVRQPRWAVVVEMIFLADLTAYWGHRLSHTIPWLWRFHAIHHTSRTMNWISAARFHPVNEIFTHTLNVVPLFCLGYPIDGLMPIFPFVATYALFIHSNVNITLRPLAYVVTSPVYHRFHHTLSDEGGNKNFAGLFPIFDRLFGTYYLPRHKPTELGLDDGDVPDNMWGQILYPFRAAPPLAAVSEPPPPPLSCDELPSTPHA